jgi:hypothetical protein
MVGDMDGDCHTRRLGVNKSIYADQYLAQAITPSASRRRTLGGKTCRVAQPGLRGPTYLRGEASGALHTAHSHSDMAIIVRRSFQCLPGSRSPGAHLCGRRREARGGRGGRCRCHRRDLDDTRSGIIIITSGWGSGDVTGRHVKLCSSAVAGSPVNVTGRCVRQRVCHLTGRGGGPLATQQSCMTIIAYGWISGDVTGRCERQRVSPCWAGWRAACNATIGRFIITDGCVSR